MSLFDPPCNQPTTAGSSGDTAMLLMRDGLVFRCQYSGGRAAYVCHDVQRGKYFHFGAAEFEITQLLDGQHSVSDIAAQLQALGIEWEPTDIANFLASLAQSGLAQSAVYGSPPGTSATLGNTSPADPSSAGAAAGPPILPRVLSWMVSQRIPLFHADRAAIWLTRHLHGLFSVWAVVLWCVLVSSGLWIALAHRSEWIGEISSLFSPHTWPLLFVIWVLAKLIHESGHALAARRQGVRVGRAGIMFFMLAPLAYVDVTDAWRLPRRWARIQIALGGVYVELAVAAVAVWVWSQTSDVTVRYVAAQIAMLTGPATILVNANPLLRLDGYYVLGDLLGIPNLRMHGRRQLAAKCEQLLLNRTAPASLLHGWQRTAAFWHAVCSVLFQILWMGGLLWGISFWGGGLGIALGFAALGLWVALPFIRWIGGLRHSEQWTAYRKRLSLCGALVAVGLLILAVIPSPLGRRIPVVVRYHDEQVARAASDGLVVDLLVTSGTAVTPGMVLLSMEDPELTTRRATLALEIDTARVRQRRLASQGQQAMANAQLDQIASLTHQLSELDRQLAALTIHAKRTGVIISPQLENLRGRHVSRGDVLVRVGDEQDKELLAAIHGNDLQIYRSAAAAGKPLTARLRGGQHLTVTPSPPLPRATVSVPHPALVAAAGGPIPLAAGSTDPASESSPRLAHPHTASISTLSAQASARLRAGQQGMLILGDSRSLVERLFERLANCRRQTHAVVR